MERSDFLPVLRDSTRWFIEQDPTTIVLTPRANSEGSVGPGGGRIYLPGTPRTAQQVKLIHQGGNGRSNGEGGTTFTYDYVIVGLHDASISIGDSFMIGSQKFVVDRMDPDNGYEKKAYATQFGKNPTDG